MLVCVELMKVIRSYLGFVVKKNEIGQLDKDINKRTDEKTNIALTNIQTNKQTKKNVLTPFVLNTHKLCKPDVLAV